MGLPRQSNTTPDGVKTVGGKEANATASLEPILLASSDAPDLVVKSVFGPTDGSPGEVVQVRVLRHPDLSTTTQLDEQGNVELPYVGRVCTFWGG